MSDRLPPELASNGVDYKTLNREFVTRLGTALPQYWLPERVRLARERLLQVDATITDIGWNSASRRVSILRRRFGGLQASRPAIIERQVTITLDPSV